MTKHGMSFTKNALISSALLSVLAGITVSLNGDLARAGGAGSQGISKDGGGRISVGPVSGGSRRGEDLYQASCIVCPGARAVGGIGPRLAGNPVLSNDQAF
jgi:hypothetical protein